MRAKMTKEERAASKEERLKERRESFRRCPSASIGFGDESSLWLHVTGGDYSKIEVYSCPFKNQGREKLGECYIHSSLQDLAELILALSGAYNEHVRILNETATEVHLDKALEVTPQ
jgi:hypothetical protein